MNKTINIGNIGKDAYFSNQDSGDNFCDESSKPCCAIGHADAAILDGADFTLYEFREAYQKCAVVYFNDTFYEEESVEDINDTATDKDRQLLYAATLGVLGYKLYNFPDASKLASKVKRKNK